MTGSSYSESNIVQALQTLESVEETIVQLMDWNKDISDVDSYYSSPQGIQLLAANCTLITAIGEGINRINRFLPDFLQSEFPEISWRAIIGMRNHIAHGYFELDADLIFEAVKNDIPPLLNTIHKCIDRLK
ncbi:MAG: DUF86 domain-containing protein [Muribaculaceae bacterium]|nr:DUF86 domain-containing protein [Muribaculaceae bacterium]